MARMFALVALLASAAAQVSYTGSEDFDKISQFLSALDVDADAEAERRQLYSMGYECADTDNGATDSYGDSCADYEGYYWWCTNYGLYNYDDDDFSSDDMCCTCRFPTPAPTATPLPTMPFPTVTPTTSPAPSAEPTPTPPCWDTDNGATDWYGDSCATWYTWWCGLYDDDDYSSDDMCCLCGGGTDVEPSPTTTPTYAPTAIFYVEASIALDGITCDQYTTVEEGALRSAIAGTLPDVDEPDITMGECSAARRRKLLSSGVSIAFTIAYTTSDASGTSADAVTAVQTALAAAVSSGVLASDIAQALTDAGSPATVTVTGVTASAPDPSPPPTPAPVVTTTAPVANIVTTSAGVRAGVSMVVALLGVFAAMA